MKQTKLIEIVEKLRIFRPTAGEFLRKFKLGDIWVPIVVVTADGSTRRTVSDWRHYPWIRTSMMHKESSLSPVNSNQSG